MIVNVNWKFSDFTTEGGVISNMADGQTSSMMPKIILRCPWSN